MDRVINTILLLGIVGLIAFQHVVPPEHKETILLLMLGVVMVKMTIKEARKGK